MKPTALAPAARSRSSIEVSFMRSAKTSSTVSQKHPSDGARMAAGLQDEELTSIVRHHHERLDGTGYPSGLSAEEIPLGARIIAVADTFDAITAARPYRPASPHKIAIDILRNETGTQLDPAVVRAFCTHYAGLRSLALWGSFVS